VLVDLELATDLPARIASSQLDVGLTQLGDDLLGGMALLSSNLPPPGSES
jgi:hypothetical protein